MSRRDLSQPSFVDAMVSGFGKVGGFWTGSTRRSTGRRSRPCFARSVLRSMDGLELAHYIRNRWPPVKLIVVSGKLVIDSQELPPGARFFPKPYRETSIVEAMVGMFADAP
jgi:hypothetical protein